MAASKNKNPVRARRAKANEAAPRSPAAGTRVKKTLTGARPKANPGVAKAINQESHLAAETDTAKTPAPIAEMPRVQTMEFSVSPPRGNPPPLPVPIATFTI